VEYQDRYTSRAWRREVAESVVEGRGEIGIVGMAAAVANAIYNATGIRIRHIPITIEDLLD
jgi:xanthine dehydrogenase YagR molybdenum-binding subunit